MNLPLFRTPGAPRDARGGPPWEVRRQCQRAPNAADLSHTRWKLESPECTKLVRPPNNEWPYVNQGTLNKSSPTWSYVLKYMHAWVAARYAGLLG